MKNQESSNKLFKKWIEDNCKIDYPKVYQVYRAVRDEKSLKDEIPIGQAEILIKFLEEELKKLKEVLAKNGKQKKAP